MKKLKVLKSRSKASKSSCNMRSSWSNTRRNSSSKQLLSINLHQHKRVLLRSRNARQKETDSKKRVETRKFSRSNCSCTNLLVWSKTLEQRLEQMQWTRRTWCLKMKIKKTGKLIRRATSRWWTKRRKAIVDHQIFLICNEKDFPDH